MEFKSVLIPAVLGALGALTLAGTASTVFAEGAQFPVGTGPDHFKGLCVLKGPNDLTSDRCVEPSTPCRATPDDALTLCKPDPHVLAIRAGKLFDSKAGKILTNQVVLVLGDKITDVGSASSVKIPAGATVIDLSKETIMPGLIDGHTHMFNSPNKKAPVSADMGLLIGEQNTQADLRAGFTTIRDMSTHGHGHSDVDIRNAINAGFIDGPRQQVSTEGIVWGGPPPAPGAAVKPVNPLASIVIHSAEEGRAAVDTQVKEGADWIKLFPTGGYQFTPTGEFQVQVTYPLPVLEAIVDEAHKMGKKVACHVYGGEGQANAVNGGCDTVEHMLGATQELFTKMAAKGQYYDPTFMRYSIERQPQFEQLRPLFQRSVQMAVKTPGLKIMIGSGADGDTLPHGSQAGEFTELVRRGGMTPVQVLQADMLNDSEALGWQNQIGSLEKGKFADIVAVPGNPLTDITQVEHVNFVMKGGKVIRNDVNQQMASSR